MNKQKKFHDTSAFELIDTIEIANAYNTLKGGLKSKLNKLDSIFPCNNYIVFGSSAYIN